MRYFFKNYFLLLLVSFCAISFNAFACAPETPTSSATPKGADSDKENGKGSPADAKLLAEAKAAEDAAYALKRKTHTASQTVAAQPVLIASVKKIKTDSGAKPAPQISQPAATQTPQATAVAVATGALTAEESALADKYAAGFAAHVSPQIPAFFDTQRYFYGMQGRASEAQLYDRVAKKFFPTDRKYELNIRRYSAWRLAQLAQEKQLAAEAAAVAATQLAIFQAASLDAGDTLTMSPQEEAAESAAVHAMRLHNSAGNPTDAKHTAEQVQPDDFRLAGKAFTLGQFGGLRPLNLSAAQIEQMTREHYGTIANAGATNTQSITTAAIASSAAAGAGAATTNAAAHKPGPAAIHYGSLTVGQLIALHATANNGAQQAAASTAVSALKNAFGKSSAFKPFVKPTILKKIATD